MSEAKTRSLFKSEPRPAKELEERQHERYDWVAVFHSVPPDSYREMSLGYPTLMNAIRRLEKQNKIRKDEYFVTTRGTEEGKRQVFLVRRGKKTA